MELADEKARQMQQQHMKISVGLVRMGPQCPGWLRAERGSKHEDASERKQRLSAQKLPNQVVECCLL